LVDILNEFNFAHLINVSFVLAMVVPWESEAVAAIAGTCNNVMHRNTEDTWNIKTKQMIVYYFHNKGVSKITKDWQESYNNFSSYARVLCWHKYMEWFLLEWPTLSL